MRSINTTTVNVLVNDRIDRVNVVVTLDALRGRLCLFLREAFLAFAKRYCHQKMRWQAAPSACVSPSLGGLSPSGGPGTALIG